MLFYLPQESDTLSNGVFRYFYHRIFFFVSAKLISHLKYWSSIWMIDYLVKWPPLAWMHTISAPLKPRGSIFQNVFLAPDYHTKTHKKLLLARPLSEWGCNRKWGFNGDDMINTKLSWHTKNKFRNMVAHYPSGCVLKMIDVQIFFYLYVLYTPKAFFYLDHNM